MTYNPFTNDPFTNLNLLLALLVLLAVVTSRFFIGASLGGDPALDGALDVSRVIGRVVIRD